MTISSSAIVRLLREAEMPERLAVELLERYVALRMSEAAEDIVREACEEILLRTGSRPKHGTRLN